MRESLSIFSVWEFIEDPLGGVPPPLVFDFGRFVAWTEVLRDCVVKLGGFFQVVGKAWGLERIWEVLGESWMGSGLLLGILVGFWEALGPSLALLGGSWAVLGSSWTLLGSAWALLGCSRAALGRLWIAFGRQVGAKMDTKTRKVKPKTFQNRGQDDPR